MRPIHAASAFVAATAALTAALPASSTATAQTPQWPIPGKTIRIVLPFPAGGAGTFMMARLMARNYQRTSACRSWSTTKPGASTIIGAQEVARATPDGHTLLYTIVVTHTQNSAPLCEAAVRSVQGRPHATIAGGALRHCTCRQQGRAIQ